MHEDNRSNSESKSSSDNESLISVLSNSEISDFEHTKTSSEVDENRVHQNSTTSFATPAGVTWNLLDPNHNYFGRLSSHNVIREATWSPAQARRCIFKESVRSAWDLLIDKSILRCIQILPKRLEEFYKQMTGDFLFIYMKLWNLENQAKYILKYIQKRKEETQEGTQYSFIK